MNNKNNLWTPKEVRKILNTVSRFALLGIIIYYCAGFLAVLLLFIYVGTPIFLFTSCTYTTNGFIYLIFLIIFTIFIIRPFIKYCLRSLWNFVKGIE